MSKATVKSEKLAGLDIPITADGVTYHLKCKNSELADRIILVGDPGRVDYVASFFDENSVNFRSDNREIFIATGTYKGTPVSVVSTGMGTDNIEIVINEIHVLKEFDVERLAWRPRAGDADLPRDAKLFDPSSIKIIRVGTCGSPSPDIPIAALAVTRHALGMDNTSLYYKAFEQMALSKDLQEVRDVVRGQTGLSAIDVYTSRAHPSITNGIIAACQAFNRDLPPSTPPQPYFVGTTATGSGFYGCQGRVVGRFAEHITAPCMVDELAKLRFNVSEGTESVVNIEMEVSALCHLSNLLGYRAGAVCVVVAKRAKEQRAFATHDQLKTAMANAVHIALDTIVSLQ